MKTSDIVRRAGRNLRRAKMRTFLTSFAIAVGAFTIMMALAAGEGTRQYSNNLIQSNIDPQALFVVKDKSLFETGPGASTGLNEYNEDGLVSNTSGSQSIEALSQKSIDEIAKRDDIESVQPIYQPRVKHVAFEGVKDKKYSASVTIYDPDVLSEVASGKLPDRGSDIGQNDIVVPDGFAKTLGLDSRELIGKQMELTVAKPAKNVSQETLQQLLASGKSPEEISAQIGGEEKQVNLKIVAVTKQGSMSFNPSTSALVSSKTAKSLYDYTTEGTDSYEQYFGMTAKVKSNKDPETVKKSLEEKGYGVQTVKDLQSFLFTIVNVLQGIVAGFGVLALLASVFGIINTMYISVLERTSQIGLMRALGMPARAVGRLFRYEAAWIGFLGGAIGIGLAYLAVWLLNPWITRSLDLGEGNTLLAFTWWQAGALLIGLIVVAITAGFFPSRKASKLDPIEALRTE